MGTQGRRVKIYQITNNVTDDVYIGSTTEALYRRLYRHKCDAKKGVQSKLYCLLRSLGVDKFKIDMVEEGVFADADAVRAREKQLIRERGCSLNEATPAPPTSPRGQQAPTPEQSEHLARIAELEQKVAELQTQLQRALHEDQTNASTHTGTPETFNISDDDLEAEAPPDDTPEYNITDKMFGMLRGKVDDEMNELMKYYYTKAIGLGKHLSKHPKDLEARDDLMLAKNALAQKIACLRCDGRRLGLEQPCLKLLEAIEKEAGICKKLRKQAAAYARQFRRWFPYEEEDDAN